MDRNLSDKIATFFSSYPKRHYDKHEVLIYAGDDPAGIHYLADGQVRQYDISAQGTETVVNVFKVGAFFPMSWAIGQTPNRYFFDAATPVTVHVAPAAEVVAFLRANSDVLYDLLRRVYIGTEGMQRRMAHLMGGTAETRVAFELVTECKRFGQRQANGGYLLPIHEDELARRAGLSRETVNRELGKLKQRHLLSVSHKDLLVPDLARLEELLGDTV